VASILACTEVVSVLPVVDIKPNSAVAFQGLSSASASSFEAGSSASAVKLTEVKPTTTRLILKSLMVIGLNFSLKMGRPHSTRKPCIFRA